MSAVGSRLNSSKNSTLGRVSKFPLFRPFSHLFVKSEDLKARPSLAFFVLVRVFREGFSREPRPCQVFHFLFLVKNLLKFYCVFGTDPDRNGALEETPRS